MVKQVYQAGKKLKKKQGKKSEGKNGECFNNKFAHLKKKTDEREEVATYTVKKHPHTR